MERDFPPRLRSFKSRPDIGASDDSRSPRIEFRGAALESLLNFNTADTSTFASKTTSGLVAEIGCGVGLHPIQYATEFPQKRIIAIERTSEKFERFASRLDSHPGLQANLCAVHADAIHFLDSNIPDQTLDEVWILYPNPEMKKTSRRWFQTPFMSRLVELMKPGAILYFATNIEPYAFESRELAPRHGFEVIKDEVIAQTSHPEWKWRTHFEKKYFQRGERLFNFEFHLSNPPKIPGVSR